MISEVNYNLSSSRIKSYSRMGPF